MQEITTSQINQFRFDGAVCLRNVIDSNQLQLLEQGVEKTLKSPTPYGRVQSKKDDPGYFFTDYYMSRAHSEFKRVFLHGPLGGIASTLIESESIRFFYDGLFVKEPGTQRASDWHQDQPYYNVDGNQICVIWIPLDAVDSQRALTFVKGSHRHGKWYQPVFFASERVLKGADTRFDPMPDIDNNPDQYPTISWDMEPGDCVAFHPLTIHGAKGNPGDKRRRALSTTWLGDDTVYGERAEEVEPVIEGHPFKVGDRLDVETVFPLVWPKPSL